MQYRRFCQNDVSEGAKKRMFQSDEQEHRYIEYVKEHALDLESRKVILDNSSIGSQRSQVFNVNYPCTFGNANG